MGLTQNLGRLSPSIFSDSSLNIGVGAAPSGSYKFEVTGTSKVSGVLTLGATLSNGTYTYTLPAATGTLALTSDIPVVTGFVPYTGATADVNLGIYTLTASGVDSVGYTAGGSGTLSGYLIIKQGTTYLGNVVGYNSINANARKYVFISDVDGTNYKSAIFELSSLTNNTDRTYTLPDASGTIALVGGSGVGTVTSVAALTIGTTGTDLSSSVANSTTTPVITLNVPTASATNRGALSSADWTTFNNKQGTITLTTTGTSGAATFSANTLNIPNYGSALSGYLPLTGGTLTGALSGTSATFTGLLTGYRGNFTGADGDYVFFINGGTGTGNSYGLRINAGTNGSDYAIRVKNAAQTSDLFTLLGTGAATFSSSIIFANNSSALCYGSSSSRFFVYNGINTYIGDIDSYAPSASLILRVNGSDRLTIASTGAATFSSTLGCSGAFIQLNQTELFSSAGASNRAWAFGLGYQTAGDFVLMQGTTASGGTYTPKFTISPTGNVGIGTSTVPAKLTIYTGVGGAFPATSGTTQSNGLVARYKDTSNACIDYGTNGGSGGWLQVTNITDLSAAYPFLINPNGGNVLIGTTTDDTVNKLQVNGTVATNGIKFPATQVASANANTLDDYEEGTFTAVVVGSTTAGTATYADQNGRYTKIGNVVYFRIDLVWTVHTGTGQITITGLPFSGAQQYMSTGMVRFNQTITALNYLGGHYFFNSTMYIEQMPVGGGSPSGVLITSSGDMRISGFIIT